MPALAKRIEIGDDDRAELERIVRGRGSSRRGWSSVLRLCSTPLRASRLRKSGVCWGARRTRCKSGVRAMSAMGSPGLGTCRAPVNRSCTPRRTRARLIAKACTRPPETPEGAQQERWTYEQLGQAVGMSGSQAHVILSRADIKPHLTEYWIMSDFSQPEFEERLGEICGLYVNPPENVLVVS